jgi:hypothetical protein
VSWAVSAPQEMAAPCAGASPLQTALAIMQGAEGYYAQAAAEPWWPTAQGGS